MYSTINTLKQILRDASGSPSNWARSNFILRPGYDAAAANDPAYGVSRSQRSRRDVKKGAIAA
ncbi:hypothetical protein [Massilia sp. KIM]|uniref:hypothetical protein n=1 Tax=Massilia sp. KIM TaxID=1955422 RepID=UPI00117EF6E9|nr:hypothetical protein [Massilia sp. KIM]